MSDELQIENNNFDPFEADETEAPARCPFCGTLPGAMHVQSDDFKLRKGYWVLCTVCGGSGPHSTSAQEAVARWNQRF